MVLNKINLEPECAKYTSSPRSDSAFPDSYTFFLSISQDKQDPILTVAGLSKLQATSLSHLISPTHPNSTGHNIYLFILSQAGWGITTSSLYKKQHRACSQH